MTGLKQDWGLASAELDGQGWSVLPGLVSATDCDRIAASYDQDDIFRSTVVMARHGFGRGEYRYFSYPLPRLVERMRTALYPPLARLANGWQERLGQRLRFPDDHADYIARCHKNGQRRPTPLLLRYGPGDYNCLHQDLYGTEVFPLQVAVLLSQPDKDFTGGEFVLTEQRPRMQSRAMVVPLKKGDGVVFAVNNRPIKG
ncbi:MAG TPA: 2OG-Fe(II) oxygenase, partial [Rhizomicrobium sp.]|nr:2OG-Fe(II) oxygenase [Rhizomicrobium sp.]